MIGGNGQNSDISGSQRRAGPRGSSAIPTWRFMGLRKMVRHQDRKCLWWVLAAKAFTQPHKEFYPRLAENIPSGLEEIEKFLTEPFMWEWDFLCGVCMDWHPKSTWGKECLRSRPHKSTKEQITTMALFSVFPDVLALRKSHRVSTQRGEGDAGAKTSVDWENFASTTANWEVKTESKLSLGKI